MSDTSNGGAADLPCVRAGAGEGAVQIGKAVPPSEGRTEEPARKLTSWRRAARCLGRFELWTNRARALTLILLVEFAAAAWVLVANLVERPSAGDLVRAGLIVVIAAAYGEATDRIERLRRYVGYEQDTAFTNAN